MSDLTEPLNARAVSAPVKKSPIIPVWIAIGVFIVAAAVAGVFTYIFTKEHFKPVNSYSANKAFTPADRYELTMTMSLPEFPGVSHPIMARVDSTNGKMELQYYNGVNRFIYDTAAGSSTISIIPLFDKLACKTTKHEQYIQLPTLFPDLDLFTKLDDRETITSLGNQVECDVWSFEYYATTKNSDYLSLIANEKGYSGAYKFYVNKDTGVPVQFTIDGRNVILGGGLSGRYTFDYSTVTTVKSFAGAVFSTPYGMYCEESQRSFGPNVRTSNLVSKITKDTAGMHHKFLSVAHAHGVAVDAKEYRERFNNFMNAEQLILESQGKDYVLEHNHFSIALDHEIPTGRNTKTAAEMKAQVGAESACELYEYDHNEVLPLVVNWSDDSTQYTQGTCASSYAISVKGMLDAQLKRAGIEGSVSQQYLVDCSAEDGVNYGGNLGCAGGLDYRALSWVLLGNNGQLASSEAYGNGATDNLNVNNYCHFSPKNQVNPFTNKKITAFATISKCLHANDGYLGNNVNQEELVLSTLHALTTGPLSISIALPADFLLYRHGIYNNLKNCPNTVEQSTHSVVAVGFTTYTDGSISLRLRNSWSAAWGDKGFADVLVKTKEGEYVNVCGVATSPVFAYVKK